MNPLDVRKAVFAGSWYPSRATDCEREIKFFLSRAKPKPLHPSSWMGGVVPHAGWYFSGQIACNVIHWLVDETPPDLVVLFGMHLHADSANYLMPKGAWETPFGTLSVNEALADYLIQRFDFKIERSDCFTQDNTIELQLPFIKYLMNPKQIIAIGVPPHANALTIGAAVVDWAQNTGCHLKIIGSTDLTHYGTNYGFTPKGFGPDALDWVRADNDYRVIQAMLAMEPEKVLDEARHHQNACCAGAVAVAVAAVRHMGATVAKQLAYATSYDKNPIDSFVGYTGVVFS
jgi:AmmeMemoRadiSam system protein B